MVKIRHGGRTSYHQNGRLMTGSDFETNQAIDFYASVSPMGTLLLATESSTTWLYSIWIPGAGGFYIQDTCLSNMD